jgi:hypothetical protein
MTDIYELPAGVKIPKRYARTINNRRLFIAGAQDAITGRRKPEQEDFVRHQGQAAWVAYALGYNAGLNWKARQGRESLPPRRELALGARTEVALPRSES